MPRHGELTITAVVARTADVVFAPLPSVQGHDSFLIDLPRFGPVIRDFLSA